MSNRVGGSEPSFINPVPNAVSSAVPANVQQSVRTQLSGTHLTASLPKDTADRAKQKLQNSPHENCYINIQVGSDTYVMLKENNGEPTLYTTKEAMSRLVDTKFVMMDLAAMPEKSSRTRSTMKVLGVGALAASAAGSAIVGLAVPALAIVAIPAALGLAIGAIASGVLISRKKSGPAMEEKIALLKPETKPTSEKSVKSFFISIWKALHSPKISFNQTVSVSSGESVALNPIDRSQSTLENEKTRKIFKRSGEGEDVSVRQQLRAQATEHKTQKTTSPHSMLSQLKDDCYKKIDNAIRTIPTTKTLTMSEKTGQISTAWILFESLAADLLDKVIEGKLTPDEAKNELKQKMVEEIRKSRGDEEDLKYTVTNGTVKMRGSNESDFSTTLFAAEHSQAIENTLLELIDSDQFSQIFAQAKES